LAEASAISSEQQKSNSSLVKSIRSNFTLDLIERPNVPKKGRTKGKIAEQNLNNSVTEEKPKRREDRNCFVERG